VLNRLGPGDLAVVLEIGGMGIRACNSPPGWDADRCDRPRFRQGKAGAATIGAHQYIDSTQDVAGQPSKPSGARVTLAKAMSAEIADSVPAAN
jgi:hypothetical protein